SSKWSIRARPGWTRGAVGSRGVPPFGQNITTATRATATSKAMMTEGSRFTLRGPSLEAGDQGGQDDPGCEDEAGDCRLGEAGAVHPLGDRRFGTDQRPAERRVIGLDLARVAGDPFEVQAVIEGHAGGIAGTRVG